MRASCQMCRKTETANVRSTLGRSIPQPGDNSLEGDIFVSLRSTPGEGEDNTVPFVRADLRRLRTRSQRTASF